MDINIIQTLLAGLLGGSVIGFIEFMIKRKDAKDDKNKEILESVDKLDKKVEGRFDILDAKITDVDKKYDERSAIASRVRILRFCDEMLEGKNHSKDSFEQVLSDIDSYEEYCKRNPSFKNNQTSTTVEHIKQNFKVRLQKNDFL